MTQQLVTANRLQDGEVVYLAADSHWGESITDAATSDDEAGQARLLAEGEAGERNQLVVGPYLMPVDVVDGEILPTSQRERIRAAGPTVRTDLGKQAQS